MAKRGIIEWAKDLKHNEKVAEKFTGVKTVSDILAVAKENGYEFTENELMDFDLDSVAGGGTGGQKTKDDKNSPSGKIKLDILTQVATASANAVGQGSTVMANPTYNFNANNNS